MKIRQQNRCSVCHMLFLLFLLSGIGSFLVTVAAETHPAAQVSPAAKKYTGTPINLSLRDADLVETLRSFAKLGKFNLVLHPGISGKVTVELKNVPWDQALEQILKIHGLGMEVTGSKVQILPQEALQARRERLRAFSTVRLDLKFAGAEALANAMNRPDAKILTNQGTVQAKPPNTLIIHESGARLLLIGRLLAQLDRPEIANKPASEQKALCLNVWAKMHEAPTASPK